MSHPEATNGSVARRSDTWKGDFQRDAMKRGRVKMADGGLIGYDDFHKQNKYDGISDFHQKVLNDALFFDRVDDPNQSELEEYRPPKLPNIPKFATGGLVGSGIGPQTVGVGSFAQGDQGGSSGSAGIGNPYANNFGFGTNSPVGTQQSSSPQAPAQQTFNGALPLNNGSGFGQSSWSFENGGLARDPNLQAPTYKDITMDFLGQTYFKPGEYDPALAMTLNAGGAGGMQQGLSAFLAHKGNNDFNAVSDEIEGKSSYTDEDMNNLARGLGIDTKGLSGRELQDYLNPKLSDYMMIGGMSAGWNPTGDIRQANGTIYKRENGQLVPYQTRGYHAAEKGSWLQENPGILPVLAIATGGLAAGYFGAAAAGAGAGAGTAAGTGAGITGAVGAAAPVYGAGVGAAGGALGTAGTGALGAGAGAIGAGYGTGALGAGITGAAGASTVAGAGTGSGWLGNVLGNSQLGSAYGSLPGWGQSAVQGAVQGAGTSGLTGGDPWRGALLGAAGGAGGYFGGDAAGPVGKQLGSMGAKYFTSQATAPQQQRKS